MVASPLSGTSAPVGACWGTSLLDQLPEAGGEPASTEALAEARARARRTLREQPLPSRRLEAWRFTDITALEAIAPTRLDAVTSQQRDPARPGLAAAGAATLRLHLDGVSDPLQGVTLPSGLEAIPPSLWGPWLAPEPPHSGSGESQPTSAGDRSGGHAAAQRPDADPWTGAVAAAVGSLLALRVRSELAVTLELVSETGTASGVLPLQLLLVLESGASLELLQVHRASGASLTAVKADLRLAAGASLRHGLIAQGDERAVLLADLAVRQEPGSSYSLVSAVSGWGLSRLEPRVLQTAGSARTRLRSLQRCDGRQVADQHSAVRFDGPDGVLDQLHKTIADGSGRSVFNGAVQVPRQAQRTDAAQLSRTLLLSDRARIDTKPQLEIVADDVTCTHGATVTRLQEDELFYLRSRGIDATAASRLLLRGFCAEVLDDLPAAAALWQPLQVLLGEEVAAP